MLPNGYEKLAHEESRFNRCSGLLLHVTSLPSRYGIGDLGSGARQFVDFLHHSKQRIWHILPLGPTGESHSPYQCRSSFAGNPLLLDPEALAERGYIDKSELRRHPRFPTKKVAFRDVARTKNLLLRKAFHGFRPDAEFKRFERFAAPWLDSYANFMATRESNGNICWTHFAKGVRPHPDDIAFHKFVQFEFHRQWDSLHAYCLEHDIRVMGDMPFYVQHDGADVWTSPENFDLGRGGEPRTVGGVPPDLFTNDGQYWGNPTYRWDHMRRDGFAWWIERIRANAGARGHPARRPFPRLRIFLANSCRQSQRKIRSLDEISRHRNLPGSAAETRRSPSRRRKTSA